MKSVEQKVTDIIIDHLGVEALKVTTEAHIGDDLGADSLDAIELCMAVEEEFNVSISDEEIEKLATVNDLHNLVKGKLETNVS